MKKKLAMIFATCMTLSLTMGCTVFGAENSTEEAKQGYDRRIEAREEKSEKQFNMAKVVTVNENTIVVTLAEKPEMPEGEEGERPERPPMPEGEEEERPERPPMPEGEEGERPERPSMLEDEEGERPIHNKKFERELNFSEEEIEITLNENIEIHTKGEEQGSIEDIQSEDIIMIYYAEDDETVEGIFVKREKEVEIE
ncbi:MAG: hypothetical protein HFE58_07500 [Firmicutes bacterium]|nr:hypothetical protein [Bacillota bacterium]